LKALDGGGRLLRPRRDFVPAYLKTYELGELTERVVAAQDLLRSCQACPRDCQVNRRENKTGVCKTGRWARVSSAFAHFGEEDCLRGWKGSGTIFFGGCNLGCVFCQNFEISQLSGGREVDASQLAAAMLRLDEDGPAVGGVLARHLVMPGLIGETQSILQWLASDVSPDTYVNLMDQYHPAHKAATEAQFSEINHHLSGPEFRQAVEHASAVGLWRLDARRPP
jgi:uncharacterized Fe-S radical SAM superfamily protein PflX